MGKIKSQQNAFLIKSESTSESCVITCISRGGLYYGVSRFEDAIPFRVLHHTQTDAVLHTTTSIKELTFGHCTHTYKQKLMTVT